MTYSNPLATVASIGIQSTPIPVTIVGAQTPELRPNGAPLMQGDVWYQPLASVEYLRIANDWVGVGGTGLVSDNNISIAELQEDIVELQGQITTLNTTVYGGNGTIGLVTKVQTNEANIVSLNATTVDLQLQINDSTKLATTVTPGTVIVSTGLTIDGTGLLKVGPTQSIDTLTTTGKITTQWMDVGKNPSTDTASSNYNLSIRCDGRIIATDGVFSGQGSFGGQVTIPLTPLVSTDAASKAYVDAEILEINTALVNLANPTTGSASSYLDDDITGLPPLGTMTNQENYNSWLYDALETIQDQITGTFTVDNVVTDNITMGNNGAISAGDDLAVMGSEIGGNGVSFMYYDRGDTGAANECIWFNNSGGGIRLGTAADQVQTPKTNLDTDGSASFANGNFVIETSGRTTIGNGQVLVGTATNAEQVEVISTNTGSNYPLAYLTGYSGSQEVRAGGPIYNAETQVIGGASLQGNVEGNATSADQVQTKVMASTDPYYFCLVPSMAAGHQIIEVDNTPGITYQPGTGTVETPQVHVNQLKLDNNYADAAAAGTPTLGLFAVIGGKLCFADGTNWSEVTLGGIVS